MKEKHSEDLQHIRFMMERSSRFISLSGLSGIVAGSIALISAFLAYKILDIYNIEYKDVYNMHNESLYLKFIFLALITLVLALGSGIFLTVRKSKKQKLPIFTKTTYKMLENLLIPLIAGGIVCIAFAYWYDFFYIAPATLLFYGLACINASHYTYGDIKYLGICEVILGLIGFFYLCHGLLLWAIGFGVLHIVYGFIMYKKYR